MNENKKTNLLKNKKFTKKIYKYLDLYFTIENFECREFESFYEIIERSKLSISNYFGKFLHKMDEKLLEFKEKTENQIPILEAQIKSEYKLTSQEFDEIVELIDY
ncbi:MAG: hypothetical protein ACLTFB_01055 [Candidatus Phytoplasma pyri]